MSEINEVTAKLEQIESNLENNPLRKFELNQSEKDTLYNMGICKFQTGDYEGALPIFQFLSGIELSNLNYLKALASCYQNLANFTAAITLYNMVYLLNPKNENDCLYYIANCYLELECNDEAYDLLKDFVEGCATYESIHLKRARILLKSLERKSQSSN